MFFAACNIRYSLSSYFCIPILASSDVAYYKLLSSIRTFSSI
nr:MAG TPA: hypothetical protein [Bacteriophage sp.]